MTVGERIKGIRLAKNLTQKQLGELCNPKMADSAIRRYENGRANPKIETLNNIAKVLGVNAYELRYGRTVGERIETYREGQKLTQEDLSEKTNIPLEKIKAYEEDQKLPTDYDLCRICEKVFAFPDDIMPSPGLNNRITSDGVVVTSADDNGINEDSKRKLLVHYDKLNKAGKEAAFNQVKLLTKIPEYQKEDTDKEE